MATTAIEKSKDFALEFGSRDNIRELADRLRKMMPNATRFSEPEALAVAQVAAMNGLDPFNGEVWGIKGSEKNGQPGEWKGVMVGIKGLRKSGHRQAEREGTVYWTEFVQVQPEAYKAKPGNIVFECHLRDTVTVQAWGKSVNILTTAGVPYTEAIKMLGPCPQVVGVGIADPTVYAKMGHVQLAKKRAEADGLKQRFDVSFGSGVIAEGDAVDAETEAAAVESENILAGAYSDIPSTQEETTESGICPPPDVLEEMDKVEEAPVDWKQRHTELWHKASKLGLLKTADAVNKYSAKANETPEQIQAKCKMLREEITQAELGYS